MFKYWKHRRLRKRKQRDIEVNESMKWLYRDINYQMDRKFHIQKIEMSNQTVITFSNPENKNHKFRDATGIPNSIASALGDLYFNLEFKLGERTRKRKLVAVPFESK